MLFCESKVPIWSSLFCYTDKTRRGAPCFLVANIPSAAIGFHKLLGFLWYIISFFNSVLSTSWKDFFPFFGTDYKFAVIFIFCPAICFLPGFQTSLQQQYMCSWENYLYLWHFSYRGSHTGFPDFLNGLTEPERDRTSWILENDWKPRDKNRCVLC